MNNHNEAHIFQFMFTICAVIKTHVSCSHFKAYTECSSHSIYFLFWHFHYSYYMDGRVNKVEDFLKTRLLDTLTEQITKVTKVFMFPSKS